MPSIRVLDQDTINQIAAGEVIERPSSVVKELVENALDAGSTAVTVEMKEGGISFLRITDNGSGIAPDQVRLAFLPHATSKIRDAKDLASIGSLGFRGEALASIAAVGRVELITKIRQEAAGIRLQIEGGAEKSFSEIGAPDGTTFVIRDLFFNTPARRKFLKTAASEASAVSALLERLALSHPDVSFRLIAGGQTRIHTSGNGNLRDLVYSIYGKEIALSLIPLDYEDRGIHIRGFAGKPEINRGNRSYENVFINGRYVRSNLVIKALENAYKGYTMQQKYPFAVFHLEMPPEELDVNVHPSKLEVRFVKEEDVYQVVYDCFRKALGGEELIPRQAFSDREADAASPKIPRGPEPFEYRRTAGERPAAVRESSVSSAESSIERILRKAGQGSSAQPVPGVVISSLADVLDEEAPAKALFPAAAGAAEAAAETAEPEADRERGSRAGAGSPEAVQKTVLEEPAAGAAGAEPSSQEESSQESAGNSEQAVPKAGNPEQAAPGTDKTEEGSSEASGFAEGRPEQLSFPEEKLFTEQTRAQYRIIGQLFDTYWLFQYKDQLLIMDQHAAHEKVLYEKNVRAFREKDFISQQLAPPLILTLNAREAQAVQEQEEVYSSYGFSIEPFGGREYAVTAIPANLPGVGGEEFLRELLDTMADGGIRHDSDLVAEKLALMSCKAAVKGNQRLSVMEVETLLDELLKLENPYMCPHGRPTIITMTKYELEKRFKRIV